MFKKLITILSIILYPINAHPWEGYDLNNQTTIDIGTGNLVRDDKLIQFFDHNTNNFHDARVIDISYDLQETRLTIFDITLQQERQFIMED